MREDEDWLATLPHAEETLDLVDAIERGFDDIEHRIESIDREHSKYVRATVTRLGYLLNREEDMKGLLVQLMTAIGGENMDERLAEAAGRMNLSSLDILSENPCTSRESSGRISSARWKSGRKRRPAVYQRGAAPEPDAGPLQPERDPGISGQPCQGRRVPPDGDSVRTPADF